MRRRSIVLLTVLGLASALHLPPIPGRAVAQDPSTDATPVDPVDPVDPARAALDAALDDERHAIAFYAAVMRRHGQVRPFSQIIQAERRHAAALLGHYERLDHPVPADRWASHAFDVPATIAEACDVAAVAEVRNGEIYDRLIKVTGDTALRRTFDALRRASVERHLPAFQRRGSGWAPVDAPAFTAVQRAQQQRATAAKTALFTALMGELVPAMRQGGPPAAIEICADRAPDLARAVSTEHGLTIGRTSWRLRNPKNAPPVWAELPLDARPAEPLHLADRGGRFGAIMPIHVNAQCLACHGAKDALAPGVAKALAARYPDDAATGFAAGDLRGWFWVEVPATQPGAPPSDQPHN